MTKTHTHTTGPWEINKTQSRRSGVIKSEHQSLGIAEVFGGGEQGEANARLIAAAPELLDALERLTHPMASDEDVAHALSVIAKAKGGEA